MSCEHAIEFLVGFRTEFIMLRPTSPVVPSDVHQWSPASGLLLGSAGVTVLREMGDSLRSNSISLQLLHHEPSPEQYEVFTGPMSTFDVHFPYIDHCGGHLTENVRALYK
jgi:hypothetical protein